MQVSGTASPLKLKNATEGHLGELNAFVAAMRNWTAWEMATTIAGADIIHDRLIFAAITFESIVSLRDKYMGLASRIIDTLSKAKRAFEREQLLTSIHKSGGEESAAKRPRAEKDAEQPRRFRILRKWDAAKQPADGNTYMSVKEGDVVVATDEVDLKQPWLLVELESSKERGLIPTQSSKGSRLEELLPPAPASVAMPVSSDDDDEDDDDGVQVSTVSQSGATPPRPDSAAIRRITCPCGPAAPVSWP